MVDSSQLSIDNCEGNPAKKFFENRIIRVEATRSNSMMIATLRLRVFGEGAEEAVRLKKPIRETEYAAQPKEKRG